MSANKNSKKEMNFELDLMPVISMMSVCICFLLLTAVWTQIGAIETKQGLGQESIRNDAKAASLWISMKDGGEMTAQMMDSSQTPSNLKTRKFSVDAAGIALFINHAAELKRFEPGLKTALIMADPKINYGDVIKLMDRLKGVDIGEVGIAPL